jgi:diguanylate cyclase (GGDEF)-like protein
VEEKDVGPDPVHGDAARDDAAADRDQAAADRDQAAADRDQSQAAADRDQSQAAADRDQSQAAADRDQSQAAADRDQSQVAADGEARESDRAGSEFSARRRASDRGLAATDRERAAIDRQHAASDRIAAAQERMEAKAELRRAQIDGLTGAFGRKLGMVALEREINRAGRTNGRLVLAYVDVDGLKAINDRQGHAAGDQLLRDVVIAIRAHVRSYDPVVRVGGDEFVCALGDTVPEDARRRFEQIAATIAEIQPLASISVGFATLQPGDTVERLTQRGDAALYEAKRAR